MRLHVSKTVMMAEICECGKQTNCMIRTLTAPDHWPRLWLKENHDASWLDSRALGHHPVKNYENTSGCRPRRKTLRAGLRGFSFGGSERCGSSGGRRGRFGRLSIRCAPVSGGQLPSAPWPPDFTRMLGRRRGSSTFPQAPAENWNCSCFPPRRLLFQLMTDIWAHVAIFASSLGAMVKLGSGLRRRDTEQGFTLMSVKCGVLGCRVSPSLAQNVTLQTFELHWRMQEFFRWYPSFMS